MHRPSLSAAGVILLAFSAALAGTAHPYQSAAPLAEPAIFGAGIISTGPA